MVRFFNKNKSLLIKLCLSFTKRKKNRIVKQKYFPQWSILCTRCLILNLARRRIFANMSRTWLTYRPSEISEKNWSINGKLFLTSHLWLKAMLKVCWKSWEPFRIYQLLLVQQIQPNFTNYGWIGYTSWLVDPKGLPLFNSYF